MTALSRLTRYAYDRIGVLIALKSRRERTLQPLARTYIGELEVGR